jgi:hypothetical protein
MKTGLERPRQGSSQVLNAGIILRGGCTVAELFLETMFLEVVVKFEPLSLRGQHRDSTRRCAAAGSSLSPRRQDSTQRCAALQTPTARQSQRPCCSAGQVCCSGKPSLFLSAQARQHPKVCCSAGPSLSAQARQQRCAALQVPLSAQARQRQHPKVCCSAKPLSSSTARQSQRPCCSAGPSLSVRRQHSDSTPKVCCSGKPSLSPCAGNTVTAPQRCAALVSPLFLRVC